MTNEIAGLLESDDSGGNGIPLVLLHGFPLNRTIWSSQVRGLSDVARVIAPDLSGFGGSAGGTGPKERIAASMDEHAEDVIALLDSLHIESIVLGGVSMGGYVAMAFHRKFAHRLRGLILVDTRAGADTEKDKEARNGAMALAREKGSAAIAERMLEKMLAPSMARADEALKRRLLELMSAQPVEGVVASLTAIRDRSSSIESVTRIRVPTLVVCGSEDALIPPSESVVLRDAIPGAVLEEIAGAGHLPNYEKPEAFERVVRAFLERLGT
jgi:pimeloyl-ACP methyl ester carboxylesterase